MKKLLLFSTVVMLMLAGLAPGAVARNGLPNGFILQDTDAAYAAFDADNDCDVFVGYVRTDRLKWLGQPGGFQPHTDLEVKLTGDCVEDGYVLEGVENLLGYLPASAAEFTTLASASIDEIDVTLYLIDEYGVQVEWGVATVDLDWTAEGEVVKWKVNNPGDHSSHESMSAPVMGTVTIAETGEIQWSVDQDDAIDEDWFTETGELPGPIITFYDEITVRT